MEADDSSMTEALMVLSLPSSQKGRGPRLMCLLELRSGVKDRGVRRTTLVGVALCFRGVAGSEEPTGREGGL